MPPSGLDRAASLHWVNDRQPGIRREPGAGGGSPFRYRDARGRLLRGPRDEPTLARIRGLAIPPAWTDVWICADERGHLQATGHDARGRKQYRYHPAWQAARGDDKFARLQRFGAVLPAIRARVQRALGGGEEPTRSRVLATVVRLLDRTWLRIGNAEYARSNGSYGLSTLRNRHASVRGDELWLSFTGKSGVPHRVRLADRRVAAIVRRCRDLPGQELFQYVDAADGQPRAIGSADVNAWLAEVAGCSVTAKDFRTWHGSVLALELVWEACAERAQPGRPQELLAAVARRLGNTVAVCRKAYIHPRVLELVQEVGHEGWADQLRRQAWANVRAGRRGGGLSVAERRLLALLRQRSRLSA